MANAIFKGIVGYFTEHAPMDTYFALNSNKRHTISRGETLSGIAQQYGVSMKSIKLVNALASNQVRIGQVLKIPRG
jgi:N-acetylmuramoyl-L-alanine amidase